MELRSAFSFLALAGIGAVMAQPTIDLANNGPLPAASPYAVTSYTTTDPTGFYGPGATGADQLYGFWMLPATGNYDRYFDAPSVTGTSASFPTATVLSTNGGQDTAFYKVDANGIEMVGIRGSLEGVAPYTNGALELKFPCTFGTTWNDGFAGSYVVSSITVNRAGTVAGIADGYGDIELPAQVLTNVLRVKVRKVQTDLSAFINAYRTFDSYYYYQDGIRYPVMKTSVDSVIIGTGTPTVTYSAEWLYGPGMVGVEEIAAADVHFTPYPNPTNGLLNIATDLTDLRSVEVFSTTGQLVRSASVRLIANASGFLDLTGLTSGVYQVRITRNDGRTGSRRIVLQ